MSRLVLWAGELPHELDLDAAWLRATRLTFVAGTEDPYATPAVVARLRERLAAHGIAHDLHTFVGAHRLDAATLATVMSDGRA